MRPSALPSRSMEFCSLFVYFFSYWIIFIDLFSSPLALFSFNSFQPLNLLRDFFFNILILQFYICLVLSNIFFFSEVSYHFIYVKSKFLYLIALS